MGSLLSKVKKCDRGDVSCCHRQKKRSKGRRLFRSGKIMPKSEVDFHEIGQEVEHTVVHPKPMDSDSATKIEHEKTVSSNEKTQNQQENEFMLQYMELQDRKRDRVSKWLDIMDTDKQSYSGLYLESDCSCNTSMYSIESRHDSMVNLASHDYDPKLVPSKILDSDYMSGTLDYEINKPSNILDIDNVQAEIEDCFKPGGEYFPLYYDVFTYEVRRIYYDLYDQESESGSESEIQIKLMISESLKSLKRKSKRTNLLSQRKKL
eukprot:Seg1201.6 transcript_id=Seg1201.6/GoldUCD/mRNA.D3Y31 product="hypothetical protein" protein_id=Seg1201.6/GoldUCD/D3Y31